MPGANCAFYGCFSSGRKKISLFKIPVISVRDGNDVKVLKQNAREEWLRLILRTREMTPELKNQIEKNNIHICELHFKPECINVCKYTSLSIFAHALFMNIYDMLPKVKQ